MILGFVVGRSMKVASHMYPNNYMGGVTYCYCKSMSVRYTFVEVTMDNRVCWSIVACQHRAVAVAVLSMDCGVVPHARHR